VGGGQVFGFEHGGAHRWAELANRVFGMESEDAPLPAGFILELERPEWALLKRELLWTTGPQPIAASVGNLSRMQIQNNTKDRLIVVTRFRIRPPPAQSTYTLSFDATIIVAGLTQNICRDTRRPLVGVTRNNVASVNAIANNLPALSGNAIDRTQLPANGVDGILDGPWVLGPNSLLEICSGTANQAESFVAYGYERQALPDELAA